jgi:nucleotide-binding universal stress UspA family protein
MKPFKKLLVPVDFSQASDAALDLAISVAKTSGASLTLLHVYGIPAYAFPEGFALAPEVLTRIAAGAQEGVERLKALHRDAGVPITALSSAGVPAEDILARARDQGFDLIVMGTHGRTGLKHVLLGSVAERVVRLAPCPVLTVRGPQPETGRA